MAGGQQPVHDQAAWPSSTSSTASSRRWSPQPPQPWSPCPGVGVQTAGQLLVTVGDNPQRLRSEAAFGHLCGAAPIPASSGRTDRHRRPPGQPRLVAHRLVRMRCHPPTRAYVQRRTNQGLSKLDIMRWLQRYIARENYHQLTSPPPMDPPACLT